MAGTYETRLNEMGYTVPDAPAPAANYVPYVIVGDMVYVSGQIAKGEEGLILGTLGDDMDVAGGQEAARVCALNLIAQLKAACGGDLDRVKQVVKLGGFVNSTADFTDHPAVINGASDFVGEVFGAAGAHARAAVGCSSLPFGVAVEVEGIFQIS
ncbi:RidA family protein [Amylibacter sp. IMCC11727]|uniref:RidA family protein n=1 Tax=Amylibacter sp. IMCC11727 TaxID=3039851 RepID=UPI00244E2B8E|nr:RidA family protein [Amylibacter sp. IMCC11727]WGI21774.1 RidA family protein [Amylibacter sp. IMCC11727]